MRQGTLEVGRTLVTLASVCGLVGCRSDDISGETEMITAPFSNACPFSPALGEPVHEGLVSAGLSFLKQSVIDELAARDREIDVLGCVDGTKPILPPSVFFGAYHFDNCNFLAGTQVINDGYDDAIACANPSAIDLPALARAFGGLLHTVQDFYAHSNWVELNAQLPTIPLADSGFDKWTDFSPYNFLPGTNIRPIQGSPPAGMTVRLLHSPPAVVPFTATVRDGKNASGGLVSGTVRYELEFLENTDPTTIAECPRPVAVSHDELSKDYTGRPRFDLARDVAARQTRHEWCRLLELVFQQHGANGVKAICDNWVEERAAANAACSSLPPSALCCVPQTCGASGATCGQVPDGCGGTIDCGSCGGDGCIETNSCCGTAVSCPPFCHFTSDGWRCDPPDPTAPHGTDDDVFLYCTFFPACNFPCCSTP